MIFPESNCTTWQNIAVKQRSSDFFHLISNFFSSKVSQQNNNQSCNFGLNLFSLLKQCLGVVLVCTMLYIIILGLIIRSWDLRLDLKNWELVKHAAEQICSRSSHQSHWNLTQLSLLSLYWECLNMSQSVHTLSLSILKCCVCVSQLFDHKLIYGADFQGGLQNDELAYLMLRRGIFHDRNIFLWDSQLKLLSVLKMTYWCCCTLFIRKKFFCDDFSAILIIRFTIECWQSKKELLRNAIEEKDFFNCIFH